MNCSANYRAALMSMSKVTAAFADAMETCSGYAAVLFTAEDNIDCYCQSEGPILRGRHSLTSSRWCALLLFARLIHHRPMPDHCNKGLHHLIGNHWHVLVGKPHPFREARLIHPPFKAETLDKNFEKPLRQHLETYKTIVTVSYASLYSRHAMELMHTAGTIGIVRESIV